MQNLTSVTSPFTPAYESEEEPVTPPRPRKGVKRPFDVHDESSGEEDVETLGEPDLTGYFSRFNICKQDQIMLCRSYASYLARTIVDNSSSAKSAKRGSKSGRTE